MGRFDNGNQRDRPAKRRAAPQSRGQPRTASTPLQESPAKPARSLRRGLKILALLIVLVAAAMLYLGIKSYQMRQYQNAAEAARQVGDWNRVAAVTKLWLEADADSVPALLYAAEAAQNRGDVAQAAEYLKSLPVDHRATPAAWLRLASLYLQVLNRPSLGEATLKNVIALDPGLMRARHELLRHYGMTFQRHKVAKLARQSIQSGHEPPAAYVYLMTFDTIVYSGGEAANQRWLQSGRDVEQYAVAMLLNRARATGVGESLDATVDVETRRRELAQQQAELMALLQKYPENPELLAFLIGQATERGDVEQAARLLAQVPAAAADDARFWRYKGWLHRARDEFQDAEQAFRTAIAKDPYDWKSRHQLAEVMRLQQRPDEAQRLLAVANLGVQLRKSILDLRGIETLPVQVLEQMREYAEQVDDAAVASRLAQRIGQIQSAASVQSAPNKPESAEAKQKESPSPALNQ